ncbi:MAG: hypothetical protein Q7K29_08950 [Thermoleophilia bacterium]|nr:hypothetical protein [Thermoleophilia bacterium]
MWALPLTATAISALFSGIVFRQYLERRNPAHLSWAVALFLFAVGTACDFLAIVSGWTPLIAKTYYLCGATVVVGYLALGTLYLLAPKRLAQAWLILMLTATVFAVILLAGAEVDPVKLRSDAEPGWKAIDKPAALSVIVMAINSIGTVILVAGAVYSAVYRRYMLANILIASGTFVVAAGGSLMRLGHYEFQSGGQLAGITIMFIGVLLTMKPSEKRLPEPATPL